MADTSNTSTGGASGGWKAVVIGATGATGKHLVRLLLERKEWSKVTIVVRRSADELKSLDASGKLEEIVVNMDEMQSIAKHFEGLDAAFCTLGTTRKDAGSAEAFRKVDLEYASEFTRLAKEGGIRTYHLMSSVGANKNSWFLYPQTKGEIEDVVSKTGFESAAIYRPGLLDRGDATRTVEKFASFFMSSIPVESVAKAMIYEAEKDLREPPKEKVVIYENSVIKRLSQQFDGLH